MGCSGSKKGAGEPQPLAEAIPVAPAPAMSESSCKVKLTVQAEAGKEPETITIQMHPEWAPLGAGRFLDLAKAEYFTDVRFHRVVPGFMVQFGLAADPKVYSEWGSKPIKDDPVKR